MLFYNSIKSAFRGKKAVQVGIVNDSVVVQHYSTTIAIVSETTVRIYTGGWRTQTTKRHINSIFDALNIKAKIYQKDHVWHIVVNGVDYVFVDGFEIYLW